MVGTVGYNAVVRGKVREISRSKEVIWYMEDVSRCGRSVRGKGADTVKVKDEGWQASSL